MRKYVKRGGVSIRPQYQKLRENVWNDTQALDNEQHVIHDNDIQEIAMMKAMELGLHDFKARYLFASG